MEDNYLKNELYDLIKTDTGIFDFIQSGSLDGIWYWDIENPENEWMSPKFWETLGYDPQEKKHFASEWQDIIFQEDLKLAIENLEKHCADPNHPYDQIVRYRHASGSTIWIRCRGLAIRDQNGKPLRMLGAHLDITALKENEKVISRLTSEYEKVFNGTQDAMFLIQVMEDGVFRFIRNNLAHQNKTGILLDQIMNTSPQELLGKDLGDLVARNYQKCVDARKAITYEEELSLPEGKRLWSTTLTPILENDRVSHIVGSSTDITERKTLLLKLEKYANYDTLTGLPNRRLFFRRLEQLMTQKERATEKFALLFIDLDGFKGINDEFGHDAGDEVLITVGQRLSKCMQNNDFAARLGGDEFALIIQDMESMASVELLAQKIHKILQENIPFHTVDCKVNSCIGIAIYPDAGKDHESLLRNADSAMYEIKKKGKGGIGFYKNQQ